jgi:enoyl-CoA hydratase
MAANDLPHAGAADTAGPGPADGVRPLVAETRGAVRWLRLNRPDPLNAMSRAMAEQLRGELAETSTDDDVAVLAITGTGRAFSAGADRKEVLEGPDATIRERRTQPLWPVDEIMSYPKPLVVAMNGAAYGGGATLAMAADLRVAARSASFTFNLVKVGLTPEFGSSFLLWRQVGYSTALDLMLTGRTIDAAEAYRIGLVNRLVDGDPRAEAEALAQQLATMPAPAMLADRRSLLRQWSLPEEDAICYEVEQGKAVFGHDFQAGAARFVAGEGRHGDALPGGCAPAGA